MTRPCLAHSDANDRLEELAACHDTLATALDSFVVRWRQAFRRAKGQPELIKVLVYGASALEESRLALADCHEITTAWLAELQAERCAAERTARAHNPYRVTDTPFAEALQQTERTARARHNDRD